MKIKLNKNINKNKFECLIIFLYTLHRSDFYDPKQQMKCAEYQTYQGLLLLLVYAFRTLTSFIRTDKHC